MVYYLKYRPNTLNELDNAEVAKLVGRFLSHESIPHAYLFTGPKGTGKTSTARILAKSINCQSSKLKGDACGACDICMSIAKGESLDVMEIDAASNRGIDEIRDLREKIKLTPTQLKYKVYIIDEVHMLTTEAFNALLKTLEEPPRHAIFVLATTETHKVPETIKSRCIRVDFHKATIEETVHSLERIVKGEKLSAEKDALVELARVADGSFRDAAKLLEELALNKDPITVATVAKKVGTSDKLQVADFIELLRKRQAKEMLQMIEGNEKEGKNARQFFLEVLHELQQIFVGSFGKKTDWKREELIRVLTVLSKAFAEMKTAVIPVLPLELAVVEYCEMTSSTVVSTSPSTQKVNVVVAPTTVAPSVIPLTERWNEFLDLLKPYNHSIVGVLRSCRPLSLDNGELIIEAAYKFHAERLSESATHAIIAKVIKQMLGTEVTLKVVTRKR